MSGARTARKPALVAAAVIVAGDTIRALEPRTDGAERYVIGRVDSAYSPQFGVTRLNVGGDLWTFASDYMIEVL